MFTFIGQIDTNRSETTVFQLYHDKVARLEEVWQQYQTAIEDRIAKRYSVVSPDARKKIVDHVASHTQIGLDNTTDIKNKIFEAISKVQLTTSGSGNFRSLDMDSVIKGTDGLTIADTHTELNRMPDLKILEDNYKIIFTLVNRGLRNYIKGNVEQYYATTPDKSEIALLFLYVFQLATENLGIDFPGNWKSTKVKLLLGKYTTHAFNEEYAKSMSRIKEECYTDEITRLGRRGFTDKYFHTPELVFIDAFHIMNSSLGWNIFDLSGLVKVGLDENQEINYVTNRLNKKLYQKLDQRFISKTNSIIDWSEMTLEDYKNDYNISEFVTTEVKDINNSLIRNNRTSKPLPHESSFSEEQYLLLLKINTLLYCKNDSVYREFQNLLKLKTKNLSRECGGKTLIYENLVTQLESGLTDSLGIQSIRRNTILDYDKEIYLEHGPISEEIDKYLEDLENYAISEKAKFLRDFALGKNDYGIRIPLSSLMTENRIINQIKDTRSKQDGYSCVLNNPIKLHSPIYYQGLNAQGSGGFFISENRNIIMGGEFYRPVKIVYLDKNDKEIDISFINKNPKTQYRKALALDLIVGKQP